MDSRSREETNVGNPTDVVFTTFKSVIVIVPEYERTIQHFLHSTPSKVDIRITAITIPLPILWTSNAIHDLTNSVPGISTIDSFFINCELTINISE